MDLPVFRAKVYMGARLETWTHAADRNTCKRNRRPIKRTEKGEPNSHKAVDKTNSILWKR